MHARAIYIKKAPLDQTGAALRIQKNFRRAKGLENPHGGDDADLDARGKPIRQIRPSPFPAIQRIRAKLWSLFEDPTSSTGAKFIGTFVMGTIFFSIGCFVLETVPEYARRVKKATWTKLDMICTIIFCIEYVTRISVCSVFLPTKHHKIATVRRFILAPPNIIDLLAIAPYFIEQMSKSSTSQVFKVLRTMRLMRLLRLLKLGRRFEGLQLMMTAILNATEALFLLVFLVMMGMIFSASTVYFTEKMACPDKMSLGDDWAAYAEDCNLGTEPLIVRGYHARLRVLCCHTNVIESADTFPSIVHSFWWAIVTVATVGYGDAVPRTTAAKFVGAASMLTGILLIALPVAIVGSKFQEAYEAKQAGKGKEERQHMALDDVECPEVCKRKAASAYALIGRVDEVAQDIKSTTVTKRQVGFHMYSEMAEAIDMSPLAEHLFKKRSASDHLSPRWATLSEHSSFFSPQKKSASSRQGPASSPASSPGRRTEQHDDAFARRVHFTAEGPSFGDPAEAAPVVDQVEVFEPGREGEPEATPEGSPSNRSPRSPQSPPMGRGRILDEDMSIESFR
jgi:hypothetical protein